MARQPNPQTKPAPPEVRIEVRNRLSQEAMAALERSLPKLGRPADAHEAGMLIGIHMVFTALRAGFVVSQE